MFKKTDRQSSLFGSAVEMPTSVRRRLQASWAERFADRVFPVLLEHESLFADLYSSDTGRPNWSIARLIGLMILQEMHAQDDQSALDSLMFDSRYQHALGV